MKNIKIMLMLLIGLILLTACGGEDKVAIEDKESYVMGMDNTFAPMGFIDPKTGELVGFDVDLANEVSRRLGKEIDLQPIEWSMKETELNAGNIDFIWNGYSITPEREEEVIFSEPYLANSQIIVVLEESDIKFKKDLEGRQITLQEDSSALEAVRKEPEFVEKLKDGKPVEFPTYVECFADLKAGRSEALVGDEVLVRYFMKQDRENKYRVLDENFGDEFFGIGFRKEDVKLRDRVNEILKEIKEDGTYDELCDKWFS